MKRLACQVMAIALLALLCVASAPGASSASAHDTSQSVSPDVNITGIWHFITTDSLDPSFTLTLQQTGHHLLGHDQSGSVVDGTVYGNKMTFTVYTGISEDDYGGNGVIDPKGQHISGNIFDGLGGQGTFKAHRVK